MKYLIVNRKGIRPTMKLTPEALERLFRDEEPPTARQPDLAKAWAARMNRVPEFNTDKK